MNFKCSELQGAVYQPREILKIDDCWIVPASKGGPVLGMPDCKLFFVYQEDTAKSSEAMEEYLFVHCYQFIFCIYSYVYRLYSLRLLNRSESLVLNGEDINDIEKQIRAKYVMQDSELSRDFTKIESDYCSFLPCIVSFQEFYWKFTELFRTDEKFKGIITLFCETINGVRILYDNNLQKIAQLQTIVDTLLGQPKQSYCEHCKRNHNAETWNDFLARSLKEYHISENEICMITRVRMTLNDARVKFIHHAKYYNPNEPRNLIEDAGKIAEANLSIEQVLDKNNDTWTSIDWLNVYQCYLLIVRNLIYLQYFQA